MQKGRIMTKKLPWFGIVGLIVLAAMARLLPHLPPNFTPVGAMAIYAGAFLPLSRAVPVTLTGLLLSDLVLGFYDPVTMIFVYAGTMLNAAIGNRLGSRRDVAHLGLAAGMGAIAFFLLSNFGVWLSGGLYPPTLVGLGTCFVAAIPFFHYSLVSTILFTALLFGAHRMIGVYINRPSVTGRP